MLNLGLFLRLGFGAGRLFGTILQSLNDEFKSFFKALLRLVEFRKLDREVERENQFISSVLDSFGQVDKVLVHDKGLLGCLE